MAGEWCYVGEGVGSWLVALLQVGQRNIPGGVSVDGEERGLRGWGSGVMGLSEGVGEELWAEEVEGGIVVWRRDGVKREAGE